MDDSPGVRALRLICFYTKASDSPGQWKQVVLGGTGATHSHHVHFPTGRAAVILMQNGREPILATED